MTTTTIPHLDFSHEDFAMKSAEVEAARAQSWYATTNYGIAVLRYAEVGALLRNTDLRQGSARWPELNGVHDGPFYSWWREVLTVLEGDEHTRIRRLVNPVFTPKSARASIPFFNELANELIDGFIDRGECEFMDEFAEPFATRVITQLLGLTDIDWRRVAELSTQIGVGLTTRLSAERQEIDSAVLEMYDFAREVINDRREHPQDDLVTDLVQASRNGDSLSQDELENAVVHLVFGGLDTTKNQVGLAMQSFVRHPGEFEKLAADPALKTNAVDEVLRTNPTVTWVTREAVVDIDFQGLHIPAGTIVHLCTQPAGTDPQVIDAPGFSITEKRPQHMTFGGGIHHCLGRFIARADLAEAFQALASRISDISIAEGAVYMPDSGNTGPVTLPITFTRR